jgi:arylsulfatase
MADDLGFSDIGPYGSEIPTPNLDDLASGGIRFSQFYNTSRCCPTRASLLTGLYQHQAGMGMMTGSGKHYPDNPAYQGYLNNQCLTLAEVLRTAGYHTYMTGKWHVGSARKEMWPLQRGFDKYYGITHGASNFFRPGPKNGLMYGNDSLPTPPDPDQYYTTDAFTDYAIRFMEEQEDEKPFFCYVAYTAPHWPLHAPEEDIKKFIGRYRVGWDSIRIQRWEKQLELGIVQEKWGLSPRDSIVPHWESLSEDQKTDLDARMAIYAAMIYRMDLNIGRMVETLKRTGRYENTLILFLSDNGACPEPWYDLAPKRESAFGTGGLEHMYDRASVGHITYGQGWANAGNTPFRRYKTQSHEGGISTPFIAHWPRGIDMDPGSIIRSPAHIIDIMPTFVQISGAEYPAEVDGNMIHPMEGESLLPLLEEGHRTDHEWLFWEHRLEGAVRHGDYKLLLRENTGKWTLYNIAEDRNELQNLAESEPEMFESMKKKWIDWAGTSGVLPKQSIKLEE